MAQTDRTMRAIQLDEWGPATNMQLRQVPVPEPTPEQLRIKAVDVALRVETSTGAPSLLLRTRVAPRALVFS